MRHWCLTKLVVSKKGLILFTANLKKIVQIFYSRYGLDWIFSILCTLHKEILVLLKIGTLK